MIPYRVHLAIIGATILLIVAFLLTLFAPLPVGASAHPTPTACAATRSETLMEGVTRSTCADGSTQLQRSQATPIAPKQVRR
jgi:hypothetical protein